ncbi:MAG: ABC transporter permease [Panacibacter sp.]
MFRNYLKISWRNLVKHKSFTLINVVGLTVSLTGCLLIGLFIWDEFQYDKFIKDSTRVYRIYDERTDKQGITSIAVTPPAFAATLQQEFPEIENTLRILATQDKKLFEAGNKKAYEENGMYAEQSFFNIFPLELESGTSAKALSEPNTVVITDELARKYFGTTNVTGKTIAIDKHNLLVSGVLKPVPAHFHLNLNYIISFPTANLPAERMASWQWQQFYTYIKLKPGSNTEQLQAKFDNTIKEKAYPIIQKAGFTYLPFFQKLTDIHLHSADLQFDNAVRGNAAYVKALSIIAIFVLLIACFNFINLATARSLKRAKEVGVRKVVGAGRRQLMIQYTSETILLSLTATVFATLLTLLLLPSLNNFTNKHIVFSLFNDPVLFVVLFALGLLVGILAGIYPAFVLSGFQPVKVLKGLTGANPKSDNIRWLRQSLVVVQFALSALMIVSTIIVYKQVNYLHTKDMGFNKDQIMFFPMRGDNMFSNYETFKNELSSSANISSVSIGYGFPGDLVAGDDIIIPEKDGTKTHPVTQLMVDYDYVKTMGLHVIAGRDFSKSMSTDKDAAFIINETAVKQLGYGTPEKAIGKQMMWNVWDASVPDSLKVGKVIGVVKDFNYKSLYEEISPAVLQIYPPAYWKVAVKMKAANMQHAIADVKNVWSKFSPDYPIEYTFLDESFNKMYQSEEKLNTLLWIFCAMAIVVGCMGLFGLAAFAAEQRRKEIGIRKVLGASISSIVSMLSTDFVKLVLIASLIAFPIAWWAMNKWLEDFAYRIQISWWVFIIAGIASLLIALITVSFQAIKAAIANPVKSLRTE